MPWCWSTCPLQRQPLGRPPEVRGPPRLPGEWVPGELHLSRGRQRTCTFKQGQPAASALVRPARFRHRSGPANVLLLQLRHAPGLPQAWRPQRAQRRRPVPGAGAPVRRHSEATAQIKALASYGIKARFSNQASFSTLEQQIATGIPVPCGYLHRGPVSSLSGGGHWLIVVGITPSHLIVHNPLGEADLVNGTTLGKAARFCSYSRNFGRRWMVEGEGTGRGVVAQR